MGWWKLSLRLVFAGVLLSAPTGCFLPLFRDVPPAAGSEPMRPAQAGAGQVTRQQLQARLMAFADRYLSRTAEGTDQIKFNTTDPRCRLMAHSSKYYPATAVLAIASDPDPQAALLDLLVVVTLERMVWQDDGWAVEAFGERAPHFMKCQRDAEEDIWGVAEEILTPERAAEVRQVIEEWRRDNPGRRYVSTMRFDDFVATRGDLAERAAAVRGQGFLAPIDEATRAVDETRLLGERILFLAGRLPRVMSWQAELSVYEFTLMPETQRALTNYDQVGRSSERLATAVEQFPELLAREREALLKGAHEQTQAIDRLLNNARPVASDLKQTTEGLALVVKELRAAVRDAQPALQTVDGWFNHQGQAQPGATTNPSPTPSAPAPPDAAPAAATSPVAEPSGAPGTPAGRPFDITDYGRVAEDLRDAARETRTLVEASDNLLENRAWELRLQEVNRATEQRVAHVGNEGRALIDYAFRRAVQLLVLMGVTIVAAALLIRLIHRLLPRPAPRAA